MDSPYSHHRHHHRHSNHHHNHHPQQPPQLPPPAPGELQFRLLCPSSKAGGLIGKGGCVIRHLREDTGARIRVIDDSHCDERIILVSAPNPNPNPNPKHKPSSSGNSELDNGNCAVVQGALVKVFERIVKVDEERSEANNNKVSGGGGGGGGTSNSNGDSNGGGGEGNYSKDNVVCRMLIGSNQIGALLARGGKVLDKISLESCAQIRVFGRDLLPACALPGDDLLQIAGNFQAVKKALLSISSFLHEHSISETCHPDSYSHRGSHASDHHSRGFMTSSASENIAPNHRMIPEEDVMFKLLCPAEKTGNLIGKGGSVIRGIENETGASIKINESVSPDSDERVVIISARESVDLKRSPAQDTVMRVHNRIAEIGFEPGTPVVARLLVPSQQIGCLMGKGGFIINEMRRFTGAGIKIFGKDQGPKFSNCKDELVQVVGNVQSVQDALFQITSRIREILFPPRQHLFQEPSPSVHPRHDQFSPGHYHSPVGLNHGYESFRQGPNHPSPLSHGIERIGGANSEQDRYHYSGDRAPLPPYVPERPPSPNSWYPQAGNNAHPGRYSDAEPGLSGVTTSNSQSAQMQTTTTVEIVVPNILLPHVYGENRINLSHLTHLSGANVVVHDPKPGESEGKVVLSGTPAQLHTGQCLVQAFIFCGQPF